MATKKGGSKKDRKGKKPHKNKLTGKKYSYYSVDGDKITRKNKFCPRCGPGVFLANNKGRTYCGKCHYTEFEGKTSDVGKSGGKGDEGNVSGAKGGERKVEERK